MSGVYSKSCLEAANNISTATCLEYLNFLFSVNRPLSQVPSFLRGVILPESCHKCWHIHIDVIIKMAEPPEIVVEYITNKQLRSTRW